MITCKMTKRTGVLGAVLVLALIPAFFGCRMGTPPLASTEIHPSAIIVDHTVVNEVPEGGIPATAIETAKSTLHIAYGHNSHGAQLLRGLDRLNAFMEGKGTEPGLYAVDIYGTPPVGHWTCMMLPGDGKQDGATAGGT